jgi:hypothetical protein
VVSLDCLGGMYDLTCLKWNVTKNRSIVATLVFFPVAVLTSQIHRGSLPTIAEYDWTIGSLGATILRMQSVILLILVVSLAVSVSRYC